MTKAYWGSWSMSGRIRAAAALGRPVSGILPTTNHLESFNKTLKRSYITHWQKAGKRLRFDVFFHFLISRIIPAIFEAHHHQELHDSWVAARFPDSLQPQHPPRSRIAVLPGLAWLPPPTDPESRRRGLQVGLP